MMNARENVTTWLEHIHILTVACRQHDVAKVVEILHGQPLLLRYSQDLSLRGVLKHGSPYIVCCVLGFADILQIMLPFLATLQELHCQRSALHYAVDFHHADVVRFLLQNSDGALGFDVDNSIWNYALSKGNEEIVQLFLEYGILGNSIDRSIFYAISNYNELFRQNVVYFSSNYYRIMAPNLSEAKFRTSTLYQLIDAGFDVKNIRKDSNPDNPEIGIFSTLYVCSFGDFEGLSALISHYGFCGELEQEIQMALHQCNWEILNSLLHRDIAGKSTTTASHTAALKRSIYHLENHLLRYRVVLPFIDRILRHGADPLHRIPIHTDPFSDVSSAFDVAVQKKLVPVVALIINRLAELSHSHQFTNEYAMINASQSSTQTLDSLCNENWRFLLACFEGNEQTVIKIFNKFHLVEGKDKQQINEHLKVASQRMVCYGDDKPMQCCAHSHSSRNLPLITDAKNSDESSSSPARIVCSDLIPHSPLCQEVHFWQDNQPRYYSSSDVETPELFLWIFQGIGWLCDRNYAHILYQLLASHPRTVTHYLIDTLPDISNVKENIFHAHDSEMHHPLTFAANAGNVGMVFQLLKILLPFYIQEAPYDLSVSIREARNENENLSRNKQVMKVAENSQHSIVIANELAAMQVANMESANHESLVAGWELATSMAREIASTVDGNSNGSSPRRLTSLACRILSEYRLFFLQLLQIVCISGHVDVLRTLLRYPYADHSETLTTKESRGAILADIIFPENDANQLLELIGLMCRLPAGFGVCGSVESQSNTKWSTGVVACAKTLLEYGQRRYDRVSSSLALNNSHGSSYLCQLSYEKDLFAACHAPFTLDGLLQLLLQFGAPLFAPHRIPPSTLPSSSSSSSAAAATAPENGRVTMALLPTNPLHTANANAHLQNPEVPSISAYPIQSWSVLHEAVLYGNVAGVHYIIETAKNRQQLPAILELQPEKESNLVDVVSLAKFLATRSARHNPDLQRPWQLIAELLHREQQSCLQHLVYR